MYSNKFYPTDFKLAVKGGDKPVLVPANIKHDSAVAHRISPVESTDYLVWRLPVLFADLFEPVAKSGFGIRVRLAIRYSNRIILVSAG